jgi:hypothetical protein
VQCPHDGAPAPPHDPVAPRTEHPVLPDGDAVELDDLGAAARHRRVASRPGSGSHYRLFKT